MNERLPLRSSTLLASVALVAIAVMVWSWSRPQDTTSDLPTRTVQAGAVELTLTPQALNGAGAVFQVKMDTHTMALDMDMAASARLRVNGTAADPATWDGQGPGGHHREGTLRFATPVPAHATVELRITGLPGDATASWTAP